MPGRSPTAGAHDRFDNTAALHPASSQGLQPLVATDGRPLDDHVTTGEHDCLAA
jgi:hypothetical protein